MVFSSEISDQADNLFQCPGFGIFILSLSIAFCLRVNKSFFFSSNQSFSKEILTLSIPCKNSSLNFCNFSTVSFCFSLVVLIGRLSICSLKNLEARAISLSCKSL